MEGLTSADEPTPAGAAATASMRVAMQDTNFMDFVLPLMRLSGHPGPTSAPQDSRWSRGHSAHYRPPGVPLRLTAMLRGRTLSVNQARGARGPDRGATCRRDGEGGRATLHGCGARSGQ